MRFESRGLHQSRAKFADRIRESVTTLVTGLTCLLWSSSAAAGAGWTDYADIAELTASDRHYYSFSLAVNDNPSGCRNETGFYQDYNARGSDRMFELLLEGVKSKSRLRVYVTGRCNIDGFSEISSVSILP